MTNNTGDFVACMLTWPQQRSTIYYMNHIKRNMESHCMSSFNHFHVINHQWHARDIVDAREHLTRTRPGPIVPKTHAQTGTTESQQNRQNPSRNTGTNNTHGTSTNDGDNTQQHTHKKKNTSTRRTTTAISSGTFLYADSVQYPKINNTQQRR